MKKVVFGVGRPPQNEEKRFWRWVAFAERGKRLSAQGSIP